MERQDNNHFSVLARIGDRPFEQLERVAVERLVTKINSSDYAEHTKHDYKTTGVENARENAHNSYLFAISS